VAWRKLEDFWMCFFFGWLVVETMKKQNCLKLHFVKFRSIFQNSIGSSPFFKVEGVPPLVGVEKTLTKPIYGVKFWV